MQIPCDAFEAAGDRPCINKRREAISRYTGTEGGPRLIPNKDIYSEDSVNDRMCQFWFAKFRDENFSVEDKRCSDRSSIQ
ncbi:hypothetical protein ALC56_04914 [Trachymyrmex septentrionalis]|uniref:Uncharacterized protein n=1 Tax=Trachymyrmex septentrionalis TaxID=34720 RepID=A0A195FIW4_9HYME|nr:hypothetical protein ALC56_04914 [Trachymyrmex septentrionalis]